MSRRSRKRARSKHTSKQVLATGNMGLHPSLRRLLEKAIVNRGWQPEQAVIRIVSTGTEASPTGRATPHNRKR